MSGPRVPSLSPSQRQDKGLSPPGQEMSLSGMVLLREGMERAEVASGRVSARPL